MSLKILEILLKYDLSLEQVGPRYRSNCVFSDHEDNTPSFIVYPETNSFYCFGCQRGGDPIQFVAYYEGVSRSEAQKRLGITSDTVSEIDDILRTPQKIETDFNTETNYIISSLVRNYLQKTGNIAKVLPLIQTFDKQLLIKKLAESDAKQFIDKFSKSLQE